MMQDWHRATNMWGASTGYCDMPYMIRLSSGRVFSTLTVSATHEGSPDMKVIGLKSDDDGLTWQELGPVGHLLGRIQAWGVPWLDDEGAIYVAMLFNEPATLQIPMVPSGLFTRADIHGVIRIAKSTDDGETWSILAWVSWVPTAIDLRNPYAGQRKLFWMCGMPRVDADNVYITVSKMGQIFSGNQFGDTESFILKGPRKISENIGSSVLWPTIPTNGDGIRAQPLTGILAVAGVRPQEEPSIVLLEDEKIYGVFRTTLARIGDFSVNKDGSNLDIDWARQADGDTIYNPRAMPEIFDLGAQRYLLWHHSMGGSTWNIPTRSRADVRVGTRDGNKLVWSRPMGVAFNASPTSSISYPSAILSEDGSEIIFAATDKVKARCWRMPIERIWNA